MADINDIIKKAQERWFPAAVKLLPPLTREILDKSFDDFKEGRLEYAVYPLIELYMGRGEGDKLNVDQRDALQIPLAYCFELKGVKELFNSLKTLGKSDEGKKIIADKISQSFQHLLLTSMLDPDNDTCGEYVGNMQKVAEQYETTLPVHPLAICLKLNFAYAPALIRAFSEFTPAEKSQALKLLAKLSFDTEETAKFLLETASTADPPQIKAAAREALESIRPEFASQLQEREDRRKKNKQTIQFHARRESDKLAKNEADKFAATILEDQHERKTSRTVQTGPWKAMAKTAAASILTFFLLTVFFLGYNFYRLYENDPVAASRLHHLHMVGTTRLEEVNLKALAGGTPAERIEAYKTLKRLSSEPGNIIAALEQGLASSSPEVRLFAVSAVSDFSSSHREAEAVLRRSLVHSDPAVRSAAFTQLARVGELRDYLPFLVIGLSDPDPLVSQAAKITLDTKIKDRNDLLPALLGNFRSSNPGIREFSSTKLKELLSDQNSVFPLLSSAVNDRSAEVRSGAIRLLGALKMDAEKVFPLIAGALNDPDREAAETAVKVLAMCSLRSGQSFTELVKLASGSDRLARTATVELSSLLARQEQALTLLRRSLSSSEEQVLVFALKKLASYGPAAAPALPELL
ncbi:MAG: HEAT repeat domain-containing protein, partial [Candidatus Wallbacteria bacterium]|nr:HEAT repeat domain-containing protein [Candidatus Wallbacteria bacterium]